MNQLQKPLLFSLGKVLITKPALALVEKENINVSALLLSHQTGNWGDLCAEDTESNEYALLMGGRIFSNYICKQHRIWIITEADRSSTTVLLPEDY